MVHTIEGSRLRISVSETGAELQNLLDSETGIEYLWSGDPQFWGKKSPVLFPIVGTLKDNSYFVDGKKYQLERHGFARTMHFELIDKTDRSLLFSLKFNEETLKVYPYYFEFQVEYKVEGSTLFVGYIVKNISQEDIYFSVGGHPAFRVPLFEGDTYEDYILQFNETEHAGRWMISADGLIETSATPLLQNTNILQLKKELFYKDAIVLKHLHSTSVKLISKNNNKGIDFNFKSFPFLGIWAAKNSDFVCIEPWCGIADSVNTNMDFKLKEGIERLPAGNDFIKTWSVTLV